MAERCDVMSASWSMVAWPVMSGFIALPALAAARRRRVSRDISAVAGELTEFATAVRRAQRRLPMDEALRARVQRLRIDDATPLELARALDRADPLVLTDLAQRLATRLRRRVAFERMMLARTAPGLRRGAMAASLPLMLMGGLSFMGVQIPGSAEVALIVAQAVGCLLLWRLARVEI